jgi:hypothetical protein
MKKVYLASMKTIFENKCIHVFPTVQNAPSGLMDSVLGSIVVDRGFESRLGQTKYYYIGILAFLR